MKKAIFLDVDGTLTRPIGDVSPKVQEAIKRARDKGHYVFLCTGRNKAGIRSFLPIGFDGVICSAGGYIEIEGKVIAEHFLSHHDVEEARRLFEKNHVLYNLEATHMTFQDRQMNEIFVGQQMNEHQNSELERLLKAQKERFNQHSLQEFDQNPVPIHKMCFIAENMEQLHKPQAQLSDRYHFVIHELFSQGLINGEIIHKSMDKGKAVQKVAEYLNIPLEDTIGFGDSMNDYEMIQTCGIGVVMANGSQELKQYATCICESVQNDGIYYELKRQQLI